MKRILLIALAVMATTTAASASEASRRDRIDAREAIQKYHIQRARDRGDLTWLEKQKLNYAMPATPAPIRNLRRCSQTAEVGSWLGGPSDVLLIS